MIVKRTDLALEVHEINSERGMDDGIITREEMRGGMSVTIAEIKSGEGEKLSGKKAGIYITADIGKVWHESRENYNQKAAAISELLTELLPSLDDKTVLVAGLGNEEITADAIGPKTVARIIVTHHIKSLNRALYDELGFGDLSAFAPGVLGQTGIESASIIKSVAEVLKPACVILIDALASRRLSRLATTVQLSDTGIAPGSGVENSRAELSRETLGVPVISIGVPTIVEAATLAYDLLEKSVGDMSGNEELIENELKKHGGGFFITPKESDVIIKETSRLIASAINLALHKGMTPDDLAEYSAPA